MFDGPVADEVEDAGGETELRGVRCHYIQVEVIVEVCYLHAQFQLIEV